ncbi:hypothetical protein [Arthrobacter sp. NyZ413]|uniref:hypothetical protein n=1 Tax=Arthrobacter sp. NyZ413 TaxID=3144669 RepID=UPI003BF79F4F
MLECRISGENAYNIANYLRRQEVSLAAAMREGMKLEIQGETQLADDGTVILDVTKISENFTSRENFIAKMLAHLRHFA